MPRFRLVGYSGDRPPVPGSTPVVPNDPTSGGGGSGGGTPDDSGEGSTPPEPMVVALNNGDVFHKTDYLALGYNRFDVMVIGAAGGRGGASGVENTQGQIAAIQYSRQITLAHPYNTPSDPYFISTSDPPILTFNGFKQSFGGGAGGGGSQRRQGRLALLPTSCSVVVGSPGADNGSGNGGSGGESSFGTICRATGGAGGKLATLSTPGTGGVGGTGGSGDITGSSTTGGTGGTGGKIDGSSFNEATSGGGGTVSGELSWNYQSYGPTTIEGGSFFIRGNVYDLKETASVATYAKSAKVLAGHGSGASPFPLNGIAKEYGTKNDEPSGLVLVRLSYVIT